MRAAFDKGGRPLVLRLVVLAVLVSLGGFAIGVSTPPAAAVTTPTFIQQIAAHAPGVGSLSVTMPSNAGSGNRLVVEVGVWNSSSATATSVTDSAGDSFTELLHFAASDATELSVWSAPITASAGTRPTITARPSSRADMGIAALEYGGLSTASGTGAIDQQSQRSGTSASATSGPTPATNAANELAVGFYVDSGWGASLVPSTGFSPRTNVSPTGDMEFVVEDAVVNQGATPSAGVGTTAGTVWLMATLVFKSGVTSPPTVPGAPTGVVASAGNGSANVSWTAPSNGGSQITSYSVIPYINGVAQSSTSVAGNPPATSATIAGLTNGTTYTFTVTATNAVGTGPASTASNAITPSSSTAHGDWPTVDHDLARSGTATDETTIGIANVGSLTQAWSSKLDGKVTAQPLFLSAVQVAGATHDVLIAATNQDSLYALDAGTGAVLWKHQLLAPSPNCSIPGGLGISATPVVDRFTGRIYTVTDDGSLRTVSLADGTEFAPALPLVSNPATNVVWGGLTLINGNVYFPTGSDGCDDAPWQGGIFQVAVGGSSPQLVKHWITVPSLPASTAGGGIWGYGGVSFDANNNHVYAASADDGTGLNGNEGYTPYAGSMLALDSSLSLLGWYQPPQPANYNCGSSPPCDQDFAATPLVFHPSGCPTMLAAGNKNGNLYVTSESSLEANGGTDGSHVQAIALNITIDDLGLGGLYGTPDYDPATNHLFVTDTGPGINGVSAGLVALTVQADCSLKVAWSQSVGGAVSNSPNSTPTLANGVVYVGVNDGSVSAFNAASGARLWSSGSNGFAVYAAPIVANGRLIAGSWDGAASSDAGTIRAWVPSTAALGVNPTTLSFSATAGGANPSSQTVALTNQGSGTLSFSASADAAWLGVSPTSGSVPNTLTVQPAISGLAAGTYNGTISITPSTGAVQKVSVTLTVNQAATVPGTPTGVSATAGDRTALVSWTAPASGGSAIISYTVTPYVGGVAQPVTTVSGSPPATSVTVTGLTDGTTYAFTVYATNGVGSGQPSAPSNAVTPTAATSPMVDVKVSVNATGTTATSPAFSTSQTGETLVVFVSMDGPPTAGTQSATVSGAGLTWSLIGRSNTQWGSAEAWSANAAAKLTNVTVSSKETQSGFHQMLTVVAFKGSSGAGAFKAAGAPSGAPSGTITTTKTGSLVYGVGEDWDNAIARTVGSGQAIVSQWADGGTGTTFWVQDQTTAAGAAGSNVTISDTAPTGDQWDLLVVEVKAA
jgi:Fibronectin type III domain/PQQ-like domain/Viral BACON domain